MYLCFNFFFYDFVNFGFVFVLKTTTLQQHGHYSEIQLDWWRKTRAKCLLEGFPHIKFFFLWLRLVIRGWGVGGDTSLQLFPSAKGIASGYIYFSFVCLMIILQEHNFGSMGMIILFSLFFFFHCFVNFDKSNLQKHWLSDNHSCSFVLFLFYKNSEKSNFTNSAY